MTLAEKLYTGQGSRPYDPSKDYYAPPDYKETDWNKLIAPANDQTTILYKDGKLRDTLREIPEIVSKYSYQVRKLAQYLKTGNELRDCYNIWHWLKTHIRYKLDAAGKEQLRQPARAWADRNSGVDCDCFTIFIACLLKEMGYHNGYYTLCSFGASPKYRHIFATVKIKGKTYCIDPVMAQFNMWPPNMNKVMQIEMLSGVDGLHPTRYMDGLGGLSAIEDNLKAATVRKAQWVEMVRQQNPKAASLLIEILPLVKDIDPVTGDPLPADGATRETILQYLALKFEGMENLQPEAREDSEAIPGQNAPVGIAGICECDLSRDMYNLGMIELAAAMDIVDGDENLGFLKKLFQKIGQAGQKLLDKTVNKIVPKKIQEKFQKVINKVKDGVKKALSLIHI